MDEPELTSHEATLLRDLHERLRSSDDVPAVDLAALEAPDRPDLEEALRKLYDNDYIDGFVPDDRAYPVMIEAVTSKGEHYLKNHTL